MKKFKNRKTNEIFVVKTPSLIVNYEKNPLFTEIKEVKAKEEPKQLKENK